VSSRLAARSAGVFAFRSISSYLSASRQQPMSSRMDGPSLWLVSRPNGKLISVGLRTRCSSQHASNQIYRQAEMPAADLASGLHQSPSADSEAATHLL
jgi:hypothetical protein